MLLETDVVVVGAGAAGIAAARLLTKHGLYCVILEGSDSIGGRIRTLRVPEWHLPIELGAEFVHGRPAPTVAFNDLRLVEVPERRMLADPTLHSLPDTWQRFAAAMRDARNSPAKESVRDYLARRALPAADQELVRMLVEGYHAAPLDDVSARAIAEDAAGAGDFRQFRPVEGYGALLRLLEQDLARSHCRILLQARVRRLEWREGSVTATASTADDPEGMQVSAKRAVVTVSVGVLQAPPSDGGIDFRPVPEAFETTLPGMAMGQVTRVVLRFAQAPWPGNPGSVPTFLQVRGAPFETFWRQAFDAQIQLTAWAGGPQARELSHLDQPSLVDSALRSLARATGHDFVAIKDGLLGAHSYDFNRDPLVRGAYSYVRPGLLDPARALREPCADTLYFAGEALDLRYPATVAGALGSGEHAARKLLATWRG